MRGFLGEQGSDDRGLDTLQRQLLGVLAVARRATSLGVLSAKLGVDAAYIRTEVEPRLLELQLIELGPRGRTLTAEGLAVVCETAPPVEDPTDSAAVEVH